MTTNPESLAAPTVHWALMPVLECFEYTQQAVLDILAQTIPTRVLIIDQGSSKETNDRLRQLAEEHAPRVLLWSFNPALPSLSAAWNRGLDFVWEQDGTEAWVVNNDAKFAPHMYETLLKIVRAEDAYFVSGVGVREGDWDLFTASAEYRDTTGYFVTAGDLAKGGPDFSCFVMTREAHTGFRFDESLIPCYTEDLDMHRRMLLAGCGEDIFGVNFPFLHYASRTINRSPEERAKFNAKYDGVVRRYTAKWGGGPSHERWVKPFEGGPGEDGVTTPELHEAAKAAEALAHLEAATRDH